MFGCSPAQWDDPRFLQRLAAVLWQGKSVNASHVYARARRLMGVDD